MHHIHINHKKTLCTIYTSTTIPYLRQRRLVGRAVVDLVELRDEGVVVDVLDGLPRALAVGQAAPLDQVLLLPGLHHLARGGALDEVARVVLRGGRQHLWWVVWV